MGKQNVAMFEQAMRMFTPFDGRRRASDEARIGVFDEEGAVVQTLQQQLDALQAQINK